MLHFVKIQTVIVVVSNILHELFFNCITIVVDQDVQVNLSLLSSFCFFLTKLCSRCWHFLTQNS